MRMPQTTHELTLEYTASGPVSQEDIDMTIGRPIELTMDVSDGKNVLQYPVRGRITKLEVTNGRVKLTALVKMGPPPRNALEADPL